MMIRQCPLCDYRFLPSNMKVQRCIDTLDEDAHIQKHVRELTEKLVEDIALFSGAVPEQICLRAEELRKLLDGKFKFKEIDS